MSSPKSGWQRSPRSGPIWTPKAESLSSRDVHDVSERIVEDQPHTLEHKDFIAEDAVLEGNTEEIKDEGRPDVDDEAKLKTKSEEGGA